MDDNTKYLIVLQTLSVDWIESSIDEQTYKKLADDLRNDFDSWQEVTPIIEECLKASCIPQGRYMFFWIVCIPTFIYLYGGIEWFFIVMLAFSFFEILDTITRPPRDINGIYSHEWCSKKIAHWHKHKTSRWYGVYNPIRSVGYSLLWLSTNTHIEILEEHFNQKH